MTTFSFSDPEIGRMAAAAQAIGATAQMDPSQLPPQAIPQQSVPVVPVGYMSPDEVNARIEAARKEEKDKLYPQLTAAQQKAQELQAAQEERDRLAAEAQRLAAEAAQREAEKEMDAKTLIQKREEEWNSRFTQMQEEQARDRALYEKEREYAALQNYRSEVLRANAQSILPHLQDAAFLTGNTREEIDASAQRLVNASAATTADLQQLQEQGQRQAPGVSPYAPAMGPEGNISSTRTYTAEEIAAIPVGSPEYAQFRRQLGLDQGGGRGIFG